MEKEIREVMRKRFYEFTGMHWEANPNEYILFCFGWAAACEAIGEFKDSLENSS